MTAKCNVILDKIFCYKNITGTVGELKWGMMITW